MQFDLSYEVSKQINLALSQLDLCSLSCYFKILKIRNSEAPLGEYLT